MPQHGWLLPPQALHLPAVHMPPLFPHTLPGWTQVLDPGPVP